MSLSWGLWVVPKEFRVWVNYTHNNRKPFLWVFHNRSFVKFNFMYPAKLYKTTKKRLFNVITTSLILMLISDINKTTCFNQSWSSSRSCIIIKSGNITIALTFGLNRLKSQSYYLCSICYLLGHYYKQRFLIKCDILATILTFLSVSMGFKNDIIVFLVGFL